MRSLLASFSLLVLPVLVGCGSAGIGTANGWAAPPRTAPAASGETAPRASASAERASGESGYSAVRVVSERPSRPDERPRTTARGPRASGAPAPGLAAGMMIPVDGIDVADLRDSFTAPRSGGRVHNAIDIAAPTGTPVVAVVDGTITRKHWNRLGGRTLYLRSADGTHDFYYAHLDEYEGGIEIGSVVRRGDVLGTVGTTGNARGPHLHFQVLRQTGSGRGAPVNPYDLLTESPLYAGN
ncbi:MAG: peptidoglycan DD-metalloendopeptidase family protein [Bacteroidota bacterium]